MRNPFVESIRLVVRVAETGGFRVALIGGFALAFYGVQRATGDVDFLVCVFRPNLNTHSGAT